ncbi:MAG TPA: sialidase family protein [Candidatus Dormibacteraeota bacterium]|nr:sialidase family protein [Candidatus Dormibacteraeota bacterium]
MGTILASTTSGLLTFDLEGSPGRSALEGRHVRAIAPEAWQRLWAVVDGREIWRTEGDGWERVVSLADLAGAEDLEALCLADTRANALGGILVGTSRARLVRVNELFEIQFVDAFDRAPGRDSWYTPWGGPPDTRTISEDREQVYVNVHVGGILRSRDEGTTWMPTIDIHADVHQVATSAGRVYAAGARGLSISLDGGGSWRLRADGLHAGYCRAVAVCGPRLLLSASTGPGGGRAALYSSNLDGDHFDRCRVGLPEWFQGNIDSLCLDAVPKGELAAFGTDPGDLYASGDQGQSWSQIAAGLGRITRVLTLP